MKLFQSCKQLLQKPKRFIRLKFETCLSFVAVERQGLNSTGFLSRTPTDYHVEIINVFESSPY